MLPRISQQFFSAVLLVSLVFSCVGMSAGMILGTTLFDASSHEMHATPTASASSDDHASCCGTGSGQSEASSEDAGASHHIVAVMPSEMAFFFLIIGIAFSAYRIGVHTFDQSIVARCRAYSRRWGEQWRHAALLFLRLFSQGILHAKSW